MGVFASAAGLSAGLVGLGPLPWALRSPRVSDAGALLAGNACLIALSLALAARATALRLWLCLPLHIGAVALLRTLSASVVSKAAPAEMRGEALGALDAVSSLCRIGVPTLAGYLVDRLGIAAPFLAQAFLCTAGATTPGASSPRTAARRTARPRPLRPRARPEHCARRRLKKFWITSQRLCTRPLIARAASTFCSYASKYSASKCCIRT